MKTKVSEERQRERGRKRRKKRHALEERRERKKLFLPLPSLLFLGSSRAISLQRTRTRALRGEKREERGAKRKELPRALSSIFFPRTRRSERERWNEKKNETLSLSPRRAHGLEQRARRRRRRLGGAVDAAASDDLRRRRGGVDRGPPGGGGDGLGAGAAGAGIGRRRRRRRGGRRRRGDDDRGGLIDPARRASASGRGHSRARHAVDATHAAFKRRKKKKRPFFEACGGEEETEKKRWSRTGWRHREEKSEKRLIKNLHFLALSFPLFFLLSPTHGGLPPKGINIATAVESIAAINAFFDDGSFSTILFTNSSSYPFPLLPLLRASTAAAASSASPRSRRSRACLPARASRRAQAP